MPSPPDRLNGRSLAHRLSVGQLLASIGAAALVILVASLVVGILTIAHQGSLRHQLLAHVEPAERAALRLATAVINQETGIRGYELTGQQSFLAPYELGLAQQRREVQVLSHDPIAGTRPALATALNRINAWEVATAIPALRRTGVSLHRAGVALDVDVQSKRRFDAIRAALDTLESKILARVQLTQSDLNGSARETQITFAVIAAVLLVTALAAAVALRRLVSRPLSRLTAASRRVRSGELSQSLRLVGARDIEQLGEDVDGMRRRLVQELEAVTEARNQLAATARDLERSNTELEQFAYVASHDLQEPLRKITSFVQLLAERYHGQLDERADQYIDFAVDGARRMQQLINDLLAFSRVGRGPDRRTRADLGRLAQSAAADLQAVAEAAGAEVTIEPMPELVVDASLIRAVFQNLLSNAIKFHDDRPPRVRIEARSQDAGWCFSCTDNGIGVEPEYAERIFVIFQRLHSRDRYPGTGIGLAVSRKIVEHHGGRIWLDTTYREGARFCFTLPDDRDTMPG